ncbi:MAG: hypothetical protein ACRD3T_00140 [Terriglobia bacterium]
MNAAKRRFGRAAIVSGGFYFGFLLLAIALTKFTIYINSLPYAPAVAGDPAALSRAQDAYAGVANLLTSLATGLLAALGWFLAKLPKQRYSARHLWPAIVGAFFALLSIYFGYVSSQNVEWAIEWSVPSLDIPKLMWFRYGQFSAIVLILLC